MKRLALIDDWRRILRKAWSIRMAALAAFFSGAEIIVPLFQDALPRGVFAALSFVTVAGAFVARLVAQKELHGD